MRIATTACLVAVCALCAPTAQAQEETTTESSAELTAGTEAEATAAPAPAAEPAPQAQPEEEEPEEEEPEEKADAMNSFGFGLKLGVGMLLGQNVSAAGTGPGGTTVSVSEKRNDVGLALGLPLYFGDGHGFGADLEIFHWRQKENGYKLNYTGLQAAFGARFQLTDPLYMFVGLGPRLGIIHGDVSIGGHAALRLPVQVTYYPINMLGIVGELGLGYGVTGRGTVVNGVETNAEATRGFLLDFTVGFRFP